MSVSPTYDTNPLKPISYFLDICTWKSWSTWNSAGFFLAHTHTHTHTHTQPHTHIHIHIEHLEVLVHMELSRLLLETHTAHKGVTEAWCDSGVTVVLQWCYSGCYSGCYSTWKSWSTWNSAGFFLASSQPYREQ
jgi:hypothetical protein